MILSELKFTNRKNYSGPTITQRCEVKCDKCGEIFEGFYWKIIEQHKKFHCDLCRSCKLHDPINSSFMEKHRQIFIEMNRQNSGKTYEEIYGKEKTLEIKRGLKRTLKERGFSEKSINSWIDAGRKASIKKCKNKKLEEIVGKEKSNQIKEKISKRFSGKGNPMYGKPSPQGSGSGWSGWYKKWYFRSLLELSFMINYIEKNDFKWETGELAKYNIPYLNWEGKEKSYFSDFILENSRMIEIKPSNLKNSKDVLTKKQAAEIWCKEHNFTYELIESNSFDKLTEEEIKNLHDLGELKFIDRYEEKYIELWKDLKLK